MPAGCRLVSPPLRLKRETEALVFFAAAGDVRSLAVATGDPDPDAVSRTRGLVTLDPARPGRVRDLPWLHVGAPPAMASSRSGWIALLTEPEAFGPQARLWLWREDSPLEPLAQGDRLAAVDARCAGDACVLLTTRAADVATRGASVWMGSPQGAAGELERKDVEAEQVAEGSVPSGIVHWAPDTRTAVVAFEGPAHIAFLRVDGKGVHHAGKVERGEVFVDATSTRDALVAVMTRGARDANGCVKGGGQVELAAVGRDSVTIPAVVPPESGYARPLGDGGAFVTWIAPLNCKAPERKVVHGVVLGADGRPTSSAMAIGDADGHAMTTSGDQVHVWLRGSEGVTWLRATCRGR